jgi:hypothetical protein
MARLRPRIVQQREIKGYPKGYPDVLMTSWRVDAYGTAECLLCAIRWCHSRDQRERG